MISGGFMSSESGFEVGKEFELVATENMWKDDKSGVYLRNPGKYKISRPSDSDYRSQLEWFSANRFKDQKKVMYKEDDGINWFKITKGMDISRVKVAVKKGILVKRGKNKRLHDNKKNKNIFRTDVRTGKVIYDGPNKLLYSLLQKPKEKDIISTIEKFVDPIHLEIIMEMEQKGWNPTSAPRKNITEAITRQLNKHAIGLSSIIEEDNKVETTKDMKDK